MVRLALEQYGGVVLARLSINDKKKYFIIISIANVISSALFHLPRSEKYFILQTAVTMLSKQGFSGVSIRDFQGQST